MSLAAWLPSDPFFVCLETVSSQFYPSKISCCFIIISATSFPSVEKLGLLSHRVLVSVIFLKKFFFDWIAENDAVHPICLLICFSVGDYVFFFCQFAAHFPPPALNNMLSIFPPGS